MSMSRPARTTAIGFTALAALAFAGAGAAQAAPPTSTTVPLSIGQEAPAPVAEDASGKFTFEIEGDQLCYTLSVSGLSAAPVAAHVHIGERNVPGPVVVPLATPPAATSEVTACATADAALLANIEANGKDYYVNVHTPLNQPGEIRGQLR
jgi:hypothetical protein